MLSFIINLYELDTYITPIISSYSSLISKRLTMNPRFTSDAVYLSRAKPAPNSKINCLFYLCQISIGPFLVIQSSTNSPAGFSSQAGPSKGTLHIHVMGATQVPWMHSGSHLAEMIRYETFDYYYKLG